MESSSKNLNCRLLEEGDIRRFGSTGPQYMGHVLPGLPISTILWCLTPDVLHTFMSCPDMFRASGFRHNAHEQLWRLWYMGGLEDAGTYCHDPAFKEFTVLLRAYYKWWFQFSRNLFNSSWGPGTEVQNWIRSAPAREEAALLASPFLLIRLEFLFSVSNLGWDS